MEVSFHLQPRLCLPRHSLGEGGRAASLRDFFPLVFKEKADRGELEATITAQLKEQAEQIQKVSAQIEASRSAPQ